MSTISHHRFFQLSSYHSQSLIYYRITTRQSFGRSHSRVESSQATIMAKYDKGDFVYVRAGTFLARTTYSRETVSER
jgi:hypothetical protein